MKKLCTAIPVARSVRIIVEALMEGVNPIAPPFTKDKLGTLVEKAWKTQEAVGWTHFVQGRLSIYLGKAQGEYYHMNPDLNTKKYMTGLNWTKLMIGALIDMALVMWKNRCNSLHSSTKEEKVKKKKEKLRDRLEWCYRNSHKIPERYHNLFRMDIDTLCKKISLYYLQQWIGTFQAHSDQAIREQLRAGDSNKDSGSCGTFDTEDLETKEYWVDTNDGMNIGDKMADAGISVGGTPQVSTDGDELDIEPKPPW